MRHVDLELYRWKWHHDVYIHTVPFGKLINYAGMRWSNYWREYGAFTSVLPRQVGKTEMLLTLINDWIEQEDDYRLVCPNKHMCDHVISRGADRHKTCVATTIRNNSSVFLGINHRATHLLVDEFLHIDMKNHLIHALDFPWKTVTMISSL